MAAVPTGALILMYHAVEPGRSPLCIDPELFAAHLDVIGEANARVVTIGALADALRAGNLEANTVAITFDDGFASVAEIAAPLLLDRGLTATVFCVAGHLGGTNNWQSARAASYRSRLADADALSVLAGAGFEIGSHGVEHAPLSNTSEETLHAEVVRSRELLQQAVGAPVTSFAYPYGALPASTGRSLVAETYRAGCTTTFGLVSGDTDPDMLPRIDVHHLRRPEDLQRAVQGRLGARLRAQGAAAQARRFFVRDYATGSSGNRSRSSLVE